MLRLFDGCEVEETGDMESVEGGRMTCNRPAAGTFIAIDDAVEVVGRPDDMEDIGAINDADDDDHENGEGEKLDGICCFRPTLTPNHHYHHHPQ